MSSLFPAAGVLGPNKEIIPLRFAEEKKTQAAVTLFLAVLAAAAYNASGKSILSHRVSHNCARLVAVGAAIVGICVNVLLYTHRRQREAFNQSACQARTTVWGSFASWKRAYPNGEGLNLLSSHELSQLKRTFLHSFHLHDYDLRNCDDPVTAKLDAMLADPFCKWLNIGAEVVKQKRQDLVDQKKELENRKLNEDFEALINDHDQFGIRIKVNGWFRANCGSIDRLSPENLERLKDIIINYGNPYFDALCHEDYNVLNFKDDPNFQAKAKSYLVNKGWGLLEIQKHSYSKHFAQPVLDHIYQQEVNKLNHDMSKNEFANRNGQEMLTKAVAEIANGSQPKSK